MRSCARLEPSARFQNSREQKAGSRQRNLAGAPDKKSSVPENRAFLIFRVGCAGEMGKDKRGARRYGSAEGPGREPEWTADRYARGINGNRLRAQRECPMSPTQETWGTRILF